jgi:imidazolonepropionase-like amidohydrolase
MSFPNETRAVLGAGPLASRWSTSAVTSIVLPSIRRTLCVLVLSALVLGCGPAATRQQAPAAPIRSIAEDGAPGVLAIVGATIVDVENGHLLPNTTILLTGNRIQALGPAAGIRVPPQARMVDARGKYVIPGLIDTHIHFGMEEEGLLVIREADPVLRFLLANGVTAARDAHGGGSEADLVRLRDRVERGEAVAPRLYVSGTADLGNVEAHGARDFRDLVRRLAGLGVDGIKIIYTSRDEALAVISEAKQVGLPVYGHTWVYGGSRYGRPDLSFDFDGYTLAAVEAGLSGVMHGHSSAPQPTTAMPTPPPGPLDEDNALAWWLHTRSRWVHASEADIERLLSAMLANRTSLEPNLIVDDIRAHPDRYGSYVGDPHMGQPVADFMRVYEGRDLQLLRATLERQMAFVKRFHEAGGLVVAGTDNHPAPGFGIHDEMRLLVEAGLPPLAALQAATLNAARVLGWQERLGTIAPGKLADLVLLDANPLEDIRNTRAIHAVILNGRVVARAELNALLTPAPW